MCSQAERFLVVLQGRPKFGRTFPDFDFDKIPNVTEWNEAKNQTSKNKKLMTSQGKLKQQLELLLKAVFKYSK